MKLIKLEHFFIVLLLFFQDLKGAIEEIQKWKGTPDIIRCMGHKEKIQP